MSQEISIEKLIGNEKQILILYELLEKRSHNISHQKMPTMDQHKQFVKNNPYKVWYLVLYNKNPIGSFYIKYDNSVGIKLQIQEYKIIHYIVKYIFSNYQPEESISSEVPPYFYFNISSDNDELKNLFKRMQINKFQESYRL